METSHTCRVCKETKPLTEFTLRKGTTRPHSGRCKPCHAEETRAYIARNHPDVRERKRSAYHQDKERLAAKQREYYANNREEINQRRREQRASDEYAVAQRRRILLWKYKLTPEDFDAMVKAQNGVCAICKQPPSKGKQVLFVDHDHDTNAVRSLLCGPCNSGLGHLQDNPNILEAAAAYLRSHGKS